MLTRLISELKRGVGQEEDKDAFRRIGLVAKRLHVALQARKTCKGHGPCSKQLMVAHREMVRFLEANPVAEDPLPFSRSIKSMPLLHPRLGQHRTY